MATLNLEGEFNRKKLSKFICQELLYEYVTHNLDSFREKDVTDYLSTCRESQRELDNLNKGLRYTQAAAQIAISPKLLEGLENFEPNWKKSVRAWTLWSSQRGWRLLPYLVLLLALGLGLWVTKPWIQSLNEDVLLAERLKIEPEAEEGPSVVAPAQTSVQASPLKTANTIATAAAVTPPVAPLPLPSPATDAETSAERDEAEQMGRGFLYRANLEVSDFINTWPAIRDKIVALGGKVAGNVELGWLRKPNESYFHFSLPESNYNELEIFLKTFGPVQFSKGRHPRVMPEGQIRIIMTVKDGVTQDEAPAETP